MDCFPNQDWNNDARLLKMFTAADVSECKIQCGFLKDCKAIDSYTANGKTVCWLFDRTAHTMIKNPILGSLACRLPVKMDSPSAQCFQDMDWNNDANLLATLVVEDFDECAKSCTSRRNCKAYDSNTINGAKTCWLFDRTAYKMTRNPGNVACRPRVTMECMPGYDWNNDATTLATIQVADVEECKVQCSSTPNCVAVDYNDRQKTCYLFDRTAVFQSRNPENVACRHADAVYCMKGQDWRENTVLESLTVDDFEHCERHCSKLTNCVAYDYNTIDGRKICWFFDQQNANTLWSNPTNTACHR
jgi:hypothetical protein